MNEIQKHVNHMTTKQNNNWLAPVLLLALGSLNILFGALQLDTIQQGPHMHILWERLSRSTYDVLKLMRCIAVRGHQCIAVDNHSHRTVGCVSASSEFSVVFLTLSFRAARPITALGARTLLCQNVKTRRIMVKVLKWSIRTAVSRTLSRLSRHKGRTCLSRCFHPS